MRAMHELKEMLHKELVKIVEPGELTAGSLDAAHKLTDTIKNIDKIIMLEEDGEHSQRRGYSRAGDWMARGRFGMPYDEGGNSYAGRGRHLVRAHYSREGGGDRQTRGGYSRDDGREDMISEMEDMMRGADERDRRIIQRMIDEMRSA